MFHSTNHDDSEQSSLLQKFIISEDNRVYLWFNILVTANCLISSYYYGTLVGFRYSFENEAF